ncbi:hypothetical protein QJQ45_019457 [Haematococcus lacustris]|nr:hypothetical protein QJQ45_019457 [Haematococcus lacustris]
MEPLRVLTAINQPVVITERRCGLLEVQKSKTNCNAVVMPGMLNGVDLILGVDWMHEHDAVLKVKHGVCTLFEALGESGKPVNLFALQPKHLPGFAAVAAMKEQWDSAAEIKLVSPGQAVRQLRKGCSSWLMLVKPGDAGDQEGWHQGSLAAAVAGCSEPVGHTIMTPPGAEAPYKRMYKLSPREEAEVKKQVAELLAKGLIEPSSSPYGAPILFVQKKDGSLRMCIDYRALNKFTVRDRYPLPRIDDLFDKLAGKRMFSSLDLQSGYHQIRITEEDVPKTAFLTPMGQFQFKVLCFGLTNAPATFQRMMNNVFKPFMNVLVYIDDILVMSNTLEEHVQHLRQVLQLMRENKFYAKLAKCEFNKTQLAFLGHIVGSKGIAVVPAKVQVVKDLQAFLGLANYFRRFISGAANGGGDQELLGIIRAVREWRCYLDGAVDVTILTDHNPLIYLQTQPNLSRRQVRWMEELSRYKYEIKYIPGATNVADPISRNPALANEVALTSSSSPQNADSEDAMTMIMTLSSRAERPVYAITTRRTAARLRENAELGQVAAREAAQRANQLVPPEDLAAAHTPGQARMTSAQRKGAQPVVLGLPIDILTNGGGQQDHWHYGGSNCRKLFSPEQLASIAPPSGPLMVQGEAVPLMRINDNHFVVLGRANGQRLLANEVNEVIMTSIGQEIRDLQASRDPKQRALAKKAELAQAIEAGLRLGFSGAAVASVTTATAAATDLCPPPPARIGKRPSQAPPSQSRPTSHMRLAAAGAEAAKAALPPGGGMFWQQGPDGYNRPKSIDNKVLRKAIVRMKAAKAALPPGGGMFWQQGPDGYNRPKSIDNKVLRKAIVRMKESEVPSPVPSPPMSIVSPESPPSPSPPPSHDPGHTPPQSSGLDNDTESQPSPGPLPLPSDLAPTSAPAAPALGPATPAPAPVPAPATAAPDPAQADPATAYSVLHAVDVNRLINTVLELDERQNREVAYRQAAWQRVSQLEEAMGKAVVQLQQWQRAAFEQQQQELQRQLRQQNETVLRLQQQLQASEKARAQMQKQMLEQEQQEKKRQQQMEQLSASVAFLLKTASPPTAEAAATSVGQKRGRSGQQVDNSKKATVWRPAQYADGNAVVKKFTPEQADQWRQAVLEMGVAMTSLPGHLIPTSQLEWALQLLSLVFGYAIFNDIPLTESYGWPVISNGDLDVRYSTGQRLQMPFTTANADGSLPDDVSMSGCWTARSLRIIRKDQAMAAQQDAAGEAARTRLKQYATAVRLARPYLRQLQQHASQLSQVTLRGGTVLTNDTMHGRDVNSVGMALTKATGLVAAQALHVDVNPDPSLSTPPPTAAAAAAAAAPQISSPPSHPVPSTSAPAASSAAKPTAPPRIIWGRDGLVMIIAVGETQVLVSPGSHVQVLKVEKKHKGEISARVLKTAMKAMPNMQVYRVTLQPGEVLGMRGYTVHAGDWGLPDKASTRVHLYGSEGYINNATCFLSMLDVEFVHKCQPTSPPQRREQYDNWPPGLGPLHGGLYVQPEPYERPARPPVDRLWNSDWALRDEDVQAELTSLLVHWDESLAAEAAEAAEKEKKKGKKVAVAEVAEEAQEPEEAGGKEAGDEGARKKKQGRKRRLQDYYSTREVPRGVNSAVEDVKSYVRSCHSCQVNKSSAKKPAGLLQPLPIPAERPWDSVSMDLIVKLPASGPNKYDSILVFVDRLTKMVHLVKTWESMTATQYAKLFLEHVFRLHGMPRNGQTERVIEEMLRHFIRPDQRDWAEYLPLVEFAINNAWQESVRSTPFYLNYGYHPRLAELLDLPQKVPQAHEFVKGMKKAVEQARQCLARAQKRMKSYQVNKRREALYLPGDMVLLSTQNMRGKANQPGVRKLKPRYVGPFSVQYMVGKAAVKLWLPDEWSRLHNVFHVSLVKPYRTDASGAVPGLAGPPPVQWLDGEPQYTVEKVVGHRLEPSKGKRKGKCKKRRLEFLVKWQGHGLGFAGAIAALVIFLCSAYFLRNSIQRWQQQRYAASRGAGPHPDPEAPDTAADQPHSRQQQQQVFSAINRWADAEAAAQLLSHPIPLMSRVGAAQEGVKGRLRRLQRTGPAWCQSSLRQAVQPVLQGQDAGHQSWS